MDREFWLRMHGGSTHFPIVLLAGSVLFDLLGIFWPNESKRQGLRTAGFFCALIGVIASFAAVASGILISRGRMMGTGLLLRHHQFIWPAFAVSVSLVTWRVIVRDRVSISALRIYLVGMATASALIFVAAYFGGEMALEGETSAVISQTPPDPALVVQGQHLFLMNCAHCHADDATGDEGPNLHGVRKSDARIAAIVENGIKGEMPRFNEKLNEQDVRALIAFLRSLKA